MGKGPHDRDERSVLNAKARSSYRLAHQSGGQAVRTRRRNVPRWVVVDSLVARRDVGALAPDRGLTGGRRSEDLFATIAALPPLCREAFRLHRFEGVSYARAARGMDISPAQIHAHIAEAMLRLDRAFHGAGGETFAGRGAIADVTNEAARWFATERRGLMSLEERWAYRSWLRVAVHEAALTRLRGIWRGLEQPPAQIAPSLRYWALGRQLVAMAALSLFVLALVSQLDSPWWTTLDWWSR